MQPWKTSLPSVPESRSSVTFCSAGSCGFRLCDDLDFLTPHVPRSLQNSSGDSSESVSTMRLSVAASARLPVGFTCEDGYDSVPRSLRDRGCPKISQRASHGGSASCGRRQGYWHRMSLLSPSLQSRGLVSTRLSSLNSESMGELLAAPEAWTGC